MIPSQAAKLIVAGTQETVRAYPDENVSLRTEGLVSCIALAFRAPTGKRSLTHLNCGDVSTSETHGAGDYSFGQARDCEALIRREINWLDDKNIEVAICSSTHSFSKEFAKETMALVRKVVASDFPGINFSFRFFTSPSGTFGEGSPEILDFPTHHEHCLRANLNLYLSVLKRIVDGSDVAHIRYDRGVHDESLSPALTALLSNAGSQTYVEIANKIASMTSVEDKEYVARTLARNYLPRYVQTKHTYEEVRAGNAKRPEPAAESAASPSFAAMLEILAASKARMDEKDFAALVERTHPASISFKAGNLDISVNTDRKGKLDITGYITEPGQKKRMFMALLIEFPAKLFKFDASPDEMLEQILAIRTTQLHSRKMNPEYDSICKTLSEAIKARLEKQIEAVDSSHPPAAAVASSPVSDSIALRL